MLTETLPLSQTEVWWYNSVGELTEQTHFDGNVTDYTYYRPRPTHRETIYAYTDQTTPYETVSYAYNVNYDSEGDYHDTVTDTLAGAAEPSVTDSEYDVNGNLIQITSPQGTINYAYDPATGEETEVSTSNTDTQYGYDEAGELKRHGDQARRRDAYLAPGHLLLVRSRRQPGLDPERERHDRGTTYNNLNELTSIVDTGPSSVVYASFAYTYDLAGHVLMETDLGGRTVMYSYDSLYRLAGESISDPASGDSRTRTPIIWLATASRRPIRPRRVRRRELLLQCQRRAPLPSRSSTGDVARFIL